MRQAPQNNIARGTLQALAAVLGGTQSLHVSGFDEAFDITSILPYMYLFYKSKCFHECDGEVQRACTDPSHSCARKVVSFWRFPARRNWRFAGRALLHILQVKEINGLPTYLQKCRKCKKIEFFPMKISSQPINDTIKALMIA